MKSFRFFIAPRLTEETLKNFRAKQPQYWEHRGKQMALKLFHFVAQTVPAYQTLLKKKKMNSRTICTIEDFKKLPILDKGNYLRKSPYLDLFPDRDISTATTISATSGSTGEPFYFPRGEMQDEQYEYIAELFLKNQFEIDKKTTLGLIGFGLGIWIGGIFTYKNFNRIAARNGKLTLIPVGTNIDIYLKAIKKFGGLYEQIILMGYPPFIKDIIDEAKDHGVNWKNYNVKILMAAEEFSEKFRTYIARKVFIKNPLTDTINIYGTVELGTMAHETALTNLIRKMAMENTNVFSEIFPRAHRLPTLAQYDPGIVYFEEVDGEILASGFGCSIPLLRYRFPDIGGVVTFEQMVFRLKQTGIDIIQEAKRYNIDKTIMKLPFVYVYDRSDNAIILRGANIYSEEIRDALQHRLLEDIVTGKFTMEKKEDEKNNEFLAINNELKKNIKPTKGLKEKITKIITERLREVNSEFNYLMQLSPNMVTPHVILWPYQDSRYFKSGGKQKWVKK